MYYHELNINKKINFRSFILETRNFPEEFLVRKVSGQCDHVNVNNVTAYIKQLHNKYNEELISFELTSDTVFALDFLSKPYTNHPNKSLIFVSVVEMEQYYGGSEEGGWFSHYERPIKTVRALTLQHAKKLSEKLTREYGLPPSGDDRDRYGNGMVIRFDTSRPRFVGRKRYE